RGASPGFFDPPSGYPGWKDGKEYRTDIFDAGGTLLLQTTRNFYSQAPPSDWWANGQPDANTPAYNTFLRETTSELPQSSFGPVVNKKRFKYDDYNNPKDVWEYDFGSTAETAPLIRHTHTEYLTSGYNTIGGTP